MKIAVCDDDKRDIARLKKLIEAYDAYPRDQQLCPDIG